MSKVTTTTFASRGKVMITGEYLTLLGARAFAWPTRKQQHLSVSPLHGKKGIIEWVAKDHHGVMWFSALFDIEETVTYRQASDELVARKLANILTKAMEMGGRSALKDHAWAVETKIEWPNEWGLGSSSTLIVNISSWLGVNPFKLQEATIGGSGYDIACALSNEPIVYEKKSQIMAGKVPKSKLMLEYCGLAYSGNKANTSNAVSHFMDKFSGKDLTSKIDLINRLTYKVLEASRIEIIIQAFRIHEETIGYLLDREPVGALKYSDFDGIVKSCGAWGGDFVLFTGRQPFSEYNDHVATKYGLQLFSLAEFLV